MDNKDKSEYKKSKMQEKKNSLFELAKDYEKFKEKERKFKK